jgi:4-hydroxybenzoyl-CoA reductase subunit beta
MLRLPPFSYSSARSPAEAAAILADNGGRALLVAGGTDLLPKMKRGQVRPEVLIGVSQLPELRELRDSGSGAFKIGAGVTLAEVARHGALQCSHRGYAQAASVVSTPALRNTGTIGGNLCVDTRCDYNDRTDEWRESIGFCLKTDGDICTLAPKGSRCWAIFSSDTAPMAIALGASVVLVGTSGERELPLSSLYDDDGKQHLAKDPSEVLTHLVLPARQGWNSAYVKLRRRGSIDFPLAGAAVALKLDGQVVEDCRIVLGAVASHPIEATEAAAGLQGRPLEDDAIAEAAEFASKKAKPLDNADLFPVWRKRTLKVMVERALRQAAASNRRG